MKLVATTMLSVCSKLRATEPCPPEVTTRAHPPLQLGGLENSGLVFAQGVEP